MKEYPFLPLVSEIIVVCCSLLTMPSEKYKPRIPYSAIAHHTVILSECRSCLTITYGFSNALHSFK